MYLPGPIPLLSLLWIGLGLVDIGSAILNAQYIDGVDFRFYKLGADQASGIGLGRLKATLPEDVLV